MVFDRKTQPCETTAWQGEIQRNTNSDAFASHLPICCSCLSLVNPTRSQGTGDLGGHSA